MLPPNTMARCALSVSDASLPAVLAMLVPLVTVISPAQAPQVVSLPDAPVRILTLVPALSASWMVVL
jgi:hypothetical protein